MTSSTYVDSVGIKVEFNSGEQQRYNLRRLNSYINSINGLNVIAKERVIGFRGVILDYHVFYKNETVAKIKTGACKPDKSKKDNIYRIDIVVAGLQSYNEKWDELKYNFLLTVCSWCNDKRLEFRLSELDTDIDVSCPYINFYSMQIKKAPRTSFDPIEDQVYESTRYFQKKTKFKSYATAALDYDKHVKEGLDDFVSRHEIKFRFKKDDVISLDSIRDKIINGYDRYAIFYFEDVRVKDQVMRFQLQIENSDIPKAREYKRLVSQLKPYKLEPDINYIMDYITKLYSIKNYKMIIQNEQEPVLAPIQDYGNRFDFDGMFA